MMEADSERSNKNSSVVPRFKQCLCSLPSVKLDITVFFSSQPDEALK